MNNHTTPKVALRMSHPSLDSSLQTNVTGILDSGAEICIIPKSLLDYDFLQLITPTSDKLKGVGDQDCPVHGQLTLKLQFVEAPHFTCTITCLVTSGGKFLLGQPFLSLFEYWYKRGQNIHFFYRDLNFKVRHVNAQATEIVSEMSLETQSSSDRSSLEPVPDISTALKWVKTNQIDISHLSKEQSEIMASMLFGYKDLFDN